MHTLWSFSPEFKLVQIHVLALAISMRGSWSYGYDGHYFKSVAEMTLRVDCRILGYVLYEKEL